MRKALTMRAKSAAFTRKLLSTLASLSIGYAFGRVHQRAADEGRIRNARSFGSGAFAILRDYLNERTKDASK